MSINVRSCLQGMSSGRVTVSGRVAILKGAQAADAKSAFLAKNPQSFWVEFGDFSWFCMDDIVTARLVGGFGRIKQVRNTQPFCKCALLPLHSICQYCQWTPCQHAFDPVICLQISSEEFAAAKSDPVAQFSAPIAQHMNADHADSITAMLKHNIGIDVDAGSIKGLDRCEPSPGLCKGGC